MNKNHIILLFRISLGAVFIFSGIAKLDSIYQFEQAIFKAGVSNWNIIPYLSRFIIAAEIFLGLCFFHKEGLKKFTIPATFLMLVIFTVHLGYTIVTEGGLSGNCGCFGEKFPMTPLESLIKNIVMLGMLVYMFFTPVSKATKELAIPFSLAGLSIILVVVFFPIKPYITQNQPITKSTEISTSVPKTEGFKSAEKTDSIKSEGQTELKIKPANIKNQVADKSLKVIPDQKTEDLKDIVEPKQDQVKLLPRITSNYAPFKTFSDGNTIDLDEGIRIVTMYNSGCDHCMENAKKLCDLSKKTKLPTWRILFWGSEGEIPAFFEHSKCSTPYIFLQPQVFFPLLGKGNFPKIILLNNGNVVGEWEGDDSVEKLEESIKKM